MNDESAPFQHQLRYELLLHPLYSPDPFPCASICFPYEDMPWGEKFSSNEEVIADTESYFEEFEKSYFLEWLKNGRNDRKSLSS